jgi:uncharacterized protein YqiB (DUF1249 family)|tara:strand:- start:190 stop:600 length:411 start_codon:yes stop_codon:yes gene_type:complete
MPEYKKTNHHLTICSANYLRLKKIMFNFKKKTQRLRKNDANKNFIADIKYSSISKHTAELYLEFSNLESKILHSFNFVSNIYHDVELVEVASFNGYAPNKFPFQFEQQPKSSDEKSQQNRFFTEVLDMILTGGFYE